MKWIKCADCLPGNGEKYSHVVGRLDNDKGFVLVSLKDDPVLSGEYAIRGEEDKIFKGIITHWIPLVQPAE